MKEYIAKKVTSRMTVNDPRWKCASDVVLDYVWKDNCPSPYNTTASLVHSDEGITVLLTTDEWPLRITAMQLNETICEDSCMEFFFIPNTTDNEYINIEINPAGVYMAAKGPGRGNRPRLDSRGEIEIVSQIKPECGWSVMVFVPYTFLNKHYGKCEKNIRANFYKCGNHTVRKHFSTWNPIDTPAPDYHRPEYFGKITLSDEEI